MGAELSGYLLRGPDVFTEDQIREARKCARSMASVAEIIRGADVEQLENLPLDEISLRAAEYMLNDLGMENDEVVELLLDAKKHCESFLAFWQKPDERDTMYRSFRDGLKIVFAGDSTWGDTPDGTGYQIIRAADCLCLLERLDVY